MSGFTTSETGRTIERTWKSGDTVEAASVVDTEMQYLYSDGDFFHFMRPDTLNSSRPQNRPSATARNG